MCSNRRRDSNKRRVMSSINAEKIIQLLSSTRGGRSMLLLLLSTKTREENLTSDEKKRINVRNFRQKNTQIWFFTSHEILCSNKRRVSNKRRGSFFLALCSNRRPGVNWNTYGIYRGASFTANGPSCFGADRYLPLFWARFARQVMLRLAPLAATRFARHSTAPLEHICQCLCSSRLNYRNNVFSPLSVMLSITVAI